MTNMPPMIAAVIWAASRVRFGPITRISDTVNTDRQRRRCQCNRNENTIGGKPLNAAAPGKHVDERPITSVDMPAADSAMRADAHGKTLCRR
jgi:hypothetical protein